MNDNIFETLSKLSRKKESKVCSDSEQSLPSYIYLDENNQIKEVPLSKLDSAGSTLINRTMNYESAKLIHEFMFGK